MEPGTTPLVTAVIPTRNRPELVLRAVRSALAQTHRHLEVVVVIDGPDAATELALQGIRDSRLRVMALPRTIGGSDARNAGAEAGRGEWIAFLDDDDEWLPGKIERQLQHALASPAPFPVVSCRLIARTPRVDYVWPRRLPRQGEAISDYLIGRRSWFRGEGSLQTSTFFVPRHWFLRHPFRSGQPKHQDTEWVLRVGGLPEVEFAFVDEILAVHYIEENRGTVSTKSTWRYSFEWLQANRSLFTPRAYSAFLLFHISPEAARGREWAAAPCLLREAVRHGAPGWRDYAIFAAMWSLPETFRRRVRDLVLARAGGGGRA